MKIAGIQKNSFVDYPGKIATVIFTQGCNMKCFYCHNSELICHKEAPAAIDTGEVLGMLTTRRRFIDGVVITGGEPTIQRGLLEFISDVKKLGLCVKLDTNGTNPELLAHLANNKLIDYVAMDIKAPLSRYNEICGVHINTDNIKMSVDIIMTSGIEYEFRTTFVPQLYQEDIVEISKWIKGAGRYFLQQYRRPSLKGEVVDYRLAQTPHAPDYIQRICERIEDKVPGCRTRGVG